MSIVGLIIAFAVSLLVLLIVVMPLLAQRPASEGAFLNRQRARALAYYERVLRNLRDLEDDLATQKISQAEFDREREHWMARGVQLLKMLDELDQAQSLVHDHSADDAQIDAAIEAAVNQPQAVMTEMS